MRNTFIYSYNPHSESAKQLSVALGIPRIRHTNSRFDRASPGKVVINWGSSELPYYFSDHRIINNHVGVRISSNKFLTFEALSETELSHVPYTAERNIALEWNRTNTVFCRTILRGHGGAGIVIVKPGEDLPEAPLYTRWVKATSEWRVHVMGNNAFYVQRKVRNPKTTPTNWLVRNHDNGFIFQQGNENIPEGLEALGVAAVRACGLDFGAVDVIWREQNQKLYVLEVNSAPGLTGESINRYRNAFMEYLG